MIQNLCVNGSFFYKQCVINCGLDTHSFLISSRVLRRPDFPYSEFHEGDNRLYTWVFRPSIPNAHSASFILRVAFGRLCCWHVGHIPQPVDRAIGPAIIFGRRNGGLSLGSVSAKNLCLLRGYPVVTQPPSGYAHPKGARLYPLGLLSHPFWAILQLHDRKRFRESASNIPPTRLYP